MVVVGVDDEMCRTYLDEGRLVRTDDDSVTTDAQTLAAHVAVAKAMKTYDLSRIITFHSRVTGARSFSEEYPKVVAWMPEALQPSGARGRPTSGQMSTGKRDALLDRFRELEDDERGLMSNARCLSEGVDVPALDGVAFVRPRKSQVDIVQAVGRAIRKSSGKEQGTIIIPVHLADSDDPETVIESSKFKPIWDVCRALRAHDNVLAEELDACRTRMGRIGTEGLEAPSKIVLDLPAKVSVEFAQNLKLRIVEEASDSFEMWLGLLQRFVEREGHCLVEHMHTESVEQRQYRLGFFVANKRNEYRKGVLD